MQDIRQCEWLVTKIRDNDAYAQNLYAAMCNNDFMRNEVVEILKDGIVRGPSWRGAGSLVAELRGRGDYMDWYLSGMRDCVDGDTEVPEGFVTEEVRKDLLSIGWLVIEDT